MVKKNVAFIYLLNFRIRRNCFSNTNSGLGQAAITEARLASQTPMLWMSGILFLESNPVPLKRNGRCQGMSYAHIVSL